MPKIHSLRAIPIAVPKKPWANAKGSTTVQPAVIAELVTDDGVHGYGEINPSYGIAKETPREIVTAIGETFAGALVGRDLDVLSIGRTMNRTLLGHPQAKDAIQTAALDALGRTLGVPVHTLLGGKAVENVPITGPLGIADVDTTVADAERFIHEMGFRGLKIKIGKDPRSDVARVRAVREAVGPDVVMRVDINEAYDLTSALQVIHELEDVGLQSIEQPVPAWDYEGMARVTRSTRSLVMADEAVQSPQEAMDLVRRNVVTAFHVKGAGRGGLLGAQQIARIGQLAGYRVICGRISSLTLGAAGELHLIAATPEILLPAEMAGHLMAYDDITTQRMSLVDGMLAVPTGPGLGFDVDQEKLEYFRIDV